MGEFGWGSSLLLLSFCGLCTSLKIQRIELKNRDQNHKKALRSCKHIAVSLFAIWYQPDDWFLLVSTYSISLLLFL